MNSCKRFDNERRCQCIEIRSFCILCGPQVQMMLPMNFAISLNRSSEQNPEKNCCKAVICFFVGVKVKMTSFMKKQSKICEQNSDENRTCHDSENKNSRLCEANLRA